MLIAIDGPAGAGKSTVAKALALKLGFAYLDTGAMYRCVALLSLAAPHTPAAELAQRASIDLAATATATATDAATTVGAEGATAEGATRVLLDGRDVSDQIRTPQVSEAASQIAADPAVREALVAKQRQLIADGDWVAEGRDIGTVVAPAAAVKVFLTADPAERARRRAAEVGADAATVLAEQTLRDERDSSRAHSPLAPAPGAVTLDTSGLSIEQVVGRIAALVSRC